MTRRAASTEDREHGRQLGVLIAAQRQERGQSAPELARESSVAIDTVRSLENGRVATPTFLTVARLADALGLSLDELHARAQQGVGPAGTVA
jgi:transcriptional regulator with XRE-family HTH domain